MVVAFDVVACNSATMEYTTQVDGNVREQITASQQENEIS